MGKTVNTLTCFITASDKFETAALYALHFQWQCLFFFLLAVKEIGDDAAVYKITQAALTNSNF